MIIPAYVFADGLALSDSALSQCANTIRAGGLVGLPTETVYGLGADADNDAAVAHIFTAKGRPADHPLIVHVADLDGGISGVAHYAECVNGVAEQLMRAFWPGPLTLILPRRADIATAAAGGQNSIGLRCPAHPVAQALLHALRKPDAEQTVVWGIAAPSANRFGRISPTTAAHVQSELGDTVADLLVLDGGACAVGIESTIVDCTRSAPVLLRPGMISSAQIEAVCGCTLLPSAVLQARGEAAPRASGTLESHYAPNATVRLMDAAQLRSALQNWQASSTNQASGAASLSGETLPAAVAPQLAIYARTALDAAQALPPAVLYERMPADAESTAHALFATLRRFDEQGVHTIWVETPPNLVEWDGVRDRLQRAQA